jgi:hypothetical protein
VDIVEELTTLGHALDAAGVDYAVCGALALAIHGVPRATADIDLLVARPDAERLSDVVQRCGFTIESQPFTFASSGITMLGFTKLGTSALVVDALLVDEPLDAIWNGRERVPYGRSTVTVVSRAGLVALKLTAGRPQDLVDVQRLAALDHERAVG